VPAFVTATQTLRSAGSRARQAAVPATLALLLLACCPAQARVHRQVRPAGTPPGRSPGRLSSGAPTAGHPLTGRPGYLGVGLRDLDASEATRLHMRPNGAMGAEIVTVDRDAPAWTAGLRRGDIVIDFNGNPVDGLEDLRRRLRACAEGETVTLRVNHAGEEHTVAVTLGDEQAIARQSLERRIDPLSDGDGAGDPFPLSGQSLPGARADFTSPAPPPAGNSSRGVASTLLDALIPASYYTGLEVDPLTTQLASYFGLTGRRGLLVTAVNASSPADRAGLTAGDVILLAGGTPVASRSALAHAVRASRGKPVGLVIQRNRRELTLSLQPGRHRHP
jgi:serine protease Do